MKKNDSANSLPSTDSAWVNLENFKIALKELRNLHSRLVKVKAVDPHSLQELNKIFEGIIVRARDELMEWYYHFNGAEIAQQKNGGKVVILNNIEEFENEFFELKVKCDDILKGLDEGNVILDKSVILLDSQVSSPADKENNSNLLFSVKCVYTAYRQFNASIEKLIKYLRRLEIEAEYQKSLEVKLKRLFKNIEINFNVFSEMRTSLQENYTGWKNSEDYVQFESEIIIEQCLHTTSNLNLQKIDMQILINLCNIEMIRLRSNVY